MQFKQLKSNFGYYLLCDGTKVYQSYDTPVAIARANGSWMKSDKFYSTTTSKHIKSVGAFEKIPHTEFLKILADLGITFSNKGL